MFNDEKMDVFTDVIDEIVARTGGEYDNMSLSDKFKVATVAKKMKEIMDRYYVEQYPIICSWANLDMASLILEEQEPILPSFYDKDYNEINKIIGLQK